MSSAVFFPYRTAAGCVTLECSPAESDTTEVSGRTVLAQGLPERDTLSLSLAAIVAPGTWDRILPEKERGDLPVHVVVALRSVSSRKRTSIRLEPDDRSPGRYVGSVDLAKPDYFGEIDMTPAVVRARAGDELPYATHVGAMLAWGDPVKVRVDEPPVPPGEYLEVEFEDFLTSGNRKRRDNAKLLYMLDTDRDVPKLWLNSRIPDLEQVMRTTAPRGRIRRVRDAVYDTIVSQAWTSLASIAFSALALQLASAEGDEIDDDPLQSLPEWEQRVISLWAPKLFPGTRDEAIEQVKDSARSSLGMAELHDRLGLAIQEWAKSPDAFRGLMRWYHDEGV